MEGRGLNLTACTFVEQTNGEHVDSSTGRPAGLDSPCISRVTTGYNPQALDKATKDVKVFLHEVFQLK